MTRACGIEYFRCSRILLLCVAGSLCLQRPAVAATLLAAGLAFQVSLPDAASLQGALADDPLPAIIIPDVPDLVLSSFFFAAPFRFGPGARAVIGGIHPKARAAHGVPFDPATPGPGPDIVEHQIA
jgi:hypothetical protein